MRGTHHLLLYKQDMQCWPLSLSQRFQTQRYSHLQLKSLTFSHNTFVLNLHLLTLLGDMVLLKKQYKTLNKGIQWQEEQYFSKYLKCSGSMVCLCRYIHIILACLSYVTMSMWKHPSGLNKGADPVQACHNRLPNALCRPHCRLAHCIVLQISCFSLSFCSAT